MKIHLRPSSSLAKAIALLLATLVSGCSTPELEEPEPASYSPPPPPPPKYNPANDPQPHYSILVESSPPGVRVEFNDEFVGITPCRIRIPGTTGRRFLGCDFRGHIFKALPPASGGSSQIKRFSDGSDIPERLFFDMRLVYR